ncbi:hypothetical protein D5R81_00030 [Parashewanella spongiae]|uniref:ATP-binding protein n=1 Tax=Parashewanella spongiae TaxID=342950 RepID=A0A3A6TYC5_9GAMM|nr:ATP-binding protein [Parashewanella spongiae]MCL1076571.1 ATP-binding protein [Parashewanella spongiae]RJY19530.1 hypothetical protein D5R81_00030 [Parashewanella spongiae]
MNEAIFETKFEARNVNASRLIFGLANIGYKPYAAIEDIIDNSVSADATKVTIVIDIKDGCTLTEKNNIEKLVIIDNGKGMSNGTIRTALDIGSEVSYDKNSLSKYGFGLKSAGLSLGQNISVFSKRQEHGFTNLLCLDVPTIEENKAYGVLVDEVSDSHRVYLSNMDMGTVVSISSIVIHDTANSLKNKLVSRLGVIYYEFLTRKENNLEIEIILNGKPLRVVPQDILRREESLASYDEYNYDCKTPCKVITDKKLKLSYADENISPITINATIFPQAKMSTFAGFTSDEREKIKSYGVSSATSGFFIFRNDRLICWGDNLSIITRDLRTFRARIDITSEHDEVLNVDVSKQNLVFPDEFLDELSLICRIPKSDAEKAFKQCALMLDHDGDREGEQSSESVLDIVEEDPVTQIEPTDPEQKTKRRESIISSQDTEQIIDDSASESSHHKIRYQDTLKTPNLWQSSLDPDYGTIVSINKSHQFYQLVLQNLKAADPKRQAIECFIYCVAVGEIKTKENLKGVDFDDIEKTLSRFETVTSWNLQNWTAHNQDLFD